MLDIDRCLRLDSEAYQTNDQEEERIGVPFSCVVHGAAVRVPFFEGGFAAAEAGGPVAVIGGFALCAV